jgi:hypothetical protein
MYHQRGDEYIKILNWKTMERYYLVDIGVDGKIILKGP